MLTHKEGPENRPPPVVGDTVEVRFHKAPHWRRALVSRMSAHGVPGVSMVPGLFSGLVIPAEEGFAWRWPEGGAVQLPNLADALVDVPSGAVPANGLRTVVRSAMPDEGPCTRCSSVEVAIRPGMMPGRVACNACGAERSAGGAVQYGAAPRTRHDGDSGPIDFHEPPPVLSGPVIKTAGAPGSGWPEGGPGEGVKPPRRGFVLVACDGEAHFNPHIDHCGLCTPRWGWREVKRETIAMLVEAERPAAWVRKGEVWAQAFSSDPAPRPVPEVRRCQIVIPGTEPHPGAAPDVCGTVLGAELTPERCRVCLGTRCFSHCGGIGHFADARLVAGGGSQGWEWQVFACGLSFAGQVWRGAELLTFGGAGAAESEVVMNETLAAFSAHSMPEPELYGPPPEALLRELPQDVVRLPAIVPGHILGALASLAGHAAVRAGDVGHSLRRRTNDVIDTVKTWLEQTDAAWVELANAEDMSPRMVERCRQLRDRELVDLFARISGTL